MTAVAESSQCGPEKSEIARAIGDEGLLLPALVNRGLLANDRAKYLLALLQTARDRADDPSRAVSALREERLAAGVTDATLDLVVPRAVAERPGSYLIPGASRVHADLVAAIREMLAPLPPGDGPDPDRLDRLLAEAPDLSSDVVPGAYIDRMTAAARPGADSLHQLVMDAHRALNRAAAEVATESIGGASVYGLAPGDRPLVEAFTDGVRATSPLRFDHPGLATSATRAGERLLLQNDLGTTKAHVVVIAVEDLTVTVTYSDVHGRRLRFFTELLEHCGLTWSGAERRKGGAALGAFRVAVGQGTAGDEAGLREMLRGIGSRLVFVLDWNRARKRLETFLSRGDAWELLRWAADQRVGHMGFLALGGERLVYDAVELSARVPARYGEPLVDLLGREATVEITRFAMRAAAEGLLAAKSPLLIRDEIRVEVLRHARAAHRRLLDASSAHAGLIVECARVLHDAQLRVGADSREFLARAARRAAGWEHRADEILLRQRQAGQRVEDSRAVTALTSAADDAIDALEEAVFLLTLLPVDATEVMPPLDSLTRIAVATAREHLKVVEMARLVVDGSSGEDLEDLLVAVDQVAGLEHAADDADRRARAALVTSAPDFRSLYVADGVCRNTEEATDALLRSALGLRDHTLAVLSNRSP